MNNIPLTEYIDERLFRLLVSSVKDYSIFMIDINGFILSWNQGAEHIKGYKADEIIGKHISIFYQEGDSERKQLRHSLNQALKKGMHESEGWRVRKDGSLFWANVVITTLYNDQGTLTGFAKITRDITERKLNDQRKEEINAELERRVKKNTEKIIANELRFRKLIENSYEGITLINGRLEVTYRSPSSERINGWSTSDRTGNSALNLVHPEDMEFMQQQFAVILQTPVEPVIVTCRMRHKEGHYIDVECVFTNMLHDKNINAIVCNFRDVTEQKAVQREREKMTADLIQRNKDLEQFTYIVSHNLRAPVANIAGLTSLLADMQTPGDDEAETQKALAASVHQLDQVILDLNHILQVSSEVNDKIEVVSLPNMMEEIKLSISSMITRNQASLMYDFSAVNCMLTLKSYLYSIFQNLVINSIKYRQPNLKPVITVYSEVEGDQLHVYFKDNGRGIDLARYGSHLFGLYKKFDNSVEGKGMGLFMVKKQVENLGGIITVKSEVDKGTEFKLSFPATLRARLPN